MTRQFWLNLPVKDLARSKAFFTQLGFGFNDQHGNANLVSMLVGDNNVIVNLFPEPDFTSCAVAAVSDARQAAEVMLSIDAESPAEVDAMAKKAKAAGASVFCEPADVQGWMYGCGFADLDGHRWNVLHMDMSKLPKA